MGHGPPVSRVKTELAQQLVTVRSSGRNERVSDCAGMQDPIPRKFNYEGSRAVSIECFRRTNTWNSVFSACS